MTADKVKEFFYGALSPAEEWLLREWLNTRNTKYIFFENNRFDIENSFGRYFTVWDKHHIDHINVSVTVNQKDI